MLVIYKLNSLTKIVASLRDEGLFIVYCYRYFAPLGQQKFNATAQFTQK